MRDRDGQRKEGTDTRETCPDPRTIALLVEDALQDHKGFRNIMSLLYDEGMVRRLTGAKALGEVARRAPELMKQKWERIFRAFDDTMSCWGAAEALGEIARNLPSMRSKIVRFLRGFRKDDCSCQGYIWGMCRVCQVERERIGEFLSDIMSFLDSGHVCMVGQAIWSAGELSIREASRKIRGFLGDNRETWILENDSVSARSIGSIAEEALRKMEPENPS